MAFRARPTLLGYGRSPQLKRFSLVVLGVMVAVVLIVLFVPGVRGYIEGRVLSWLARLSS